MSKRIATIQDKDGGVWHGQVEEKPSSVTDLLLYTICPPLAVADLCTSSLTTVVVNGTSHTGREV